MNFFSAIFFLSIIFFARAFVSSLFCHDSLSFLFSISLRRSQLKRSFRSYHVTIFLFFFLQFRLDDHNSNDHFALILSRFSFFFLFNFFFFLLTMRSLHAFTSILSWFFFFDFSLFFNFAQTITAQTIISFLFSHDFSSFFFSRYYHIAFILSWFFFSVIFNRCFIAFIIFQSSQSTISLSVSYSAQNIHEFSALSSQQQKSDVCCLLYFTY